jgi:hypothetical protein
MSLHTILHLCFRDGVNGYFLGDLLAHFVESAKRGPMIPGHECSTVDH